MSRILTKLVAQQTSVTTNQPGVCRNKYQDLLFFNPNSISGLLQNWKAKIHLPVIHLA